MPIEDLSGTGGWTPDDNSFLGPWLVDGYVWIVLQEPGLLPDVEIWRSNDPFGAGFSLAATAFSSVDRADGGIWCDLYAAGGILHIVKRFDDHVEHVSYTLAASGATVATAATTITATLPTAASEDSLSMAVRSNNDVVVGYGGARRRVSGTDYRRIDYSRRVSGTWTTDVDVTGEDNQAKHFRGVSVVRGASDRIHFFFLDESAFPAGGIRHRSLSSANAFDTAMMFENDYSTIESVPMYRGQSYTDGADVRVSLPYGKPGSATETAHAAADLLSQANPTITTYTDLGDLAANYVTGYYKVVATDGGDVYHLHASKPSAGTDTVHLEYVKKPDGASVWDSAVEILSVTNHNGFEHMSANVIDRSGKKLAVLYRTGAVSGSALFYLEHDLATATGWTVGAIAF